MLSPTFRVHDRLALCNPCSVGFGTHLPASRMHKCIIDFPCVRSNERSEKRYDSTVRRLAMDTPQLDPIHVHQQKPVNAVPAHREPQSTSPFPPPNGQAFPPTVSSFSAGKQDSGELMTLCRSRDMQPDGTHCSSNIYVQSNALPALRARRFETRHSHSL